MKLGWLALIFCLGLGIGLSGCAHLDNTLPICSSETAESESRQEGSSEEAVPPTGHAAWAGDEYVIKEGVMLYYPTQESGQTVHLGDQIGDLVVEDAYTVYEADAKDDEPVHICYPTRATTWKSAANPRSLTCT